MNTFEESKFLEENGQEARTALFTGSSPTDLTPRNNWKNCFPEIIGRSRSMIKVLDMVTKVAKSDSAVLIIGESGTGKELIARAVHRLSPRAHRRFDPIICSAIPESLLESTLFGHEKGAFTNADRKRKGHFELADGGTIFLDEIGDMPISLQSKLLRVLQEKQFTPLGGNELKSVDVRIIAATNINLEKVINKTFRLDLYYRLAVLPIFLPPLRERREDIPELLEHFLDIACRKHQTECPCEITSDAMDSLINYEWPGNIRQLQNLMEQLVVMFGGGDITYEHLPKEIKNYQPPIASTEKSPLMIPENPSPPKTLEVQPNRPEKSLVYPAQFGKLTEDGVNLCELIENLENSLIKQALEMTKNNKNQAAKLLGLNRTTLVERIKKRKIGELNTPSEEL